MLDKWWKITYNCNIMDSKITINIPKRTIQIDNITRRYATKEAFWRAYEKIDDKTDKQTNGQECNLVDRKDTQD